MKLLRYMILLCCCLWLGGDRYLCFAQQYAGQKVTSFNSVTADLGVSLVSSSITQHTIKWSSTGTVSSCTVALDSSADGISWSAGGVIAGQTCTSAGSVTLTAGTVNYVRMNVTAFIGTGSVTVTWTGYNLGLTALTNTTLTNGSVLFACSSGLICQNNSNFFWNNTNNLLDVGPRTGFGSIITNSFIAPGLHLFLSLNPSGGSGAQINAFTFGLEDNLATGTHQNSVALYGAHVLTHTAGVKPSGAGIEGDVFVNGTGGTTTGASGVVGYAENDVGTATSLYGTHSNYRVSGGTVGNGWGLNVVGGVISGGTLTTGGGIRVEGPSITGGAITHPMYGMLVNPFASNDIGIKIDGGANSGYEAIRIENQSNDGSIINFTQNAVTAAKFRSFWSLNHWRLAFQTTTGNDVITIKDDDNVGIGTTDPAAKLDVVGSFQATTYKTTTNCVDSAGAAACAAAPAGHFVIDAATTSTVVSTTAVTANSEIHLTRDDSLGTLLSITCNTQSSLVLGTPRVTARTAGTSFTVSIDVGPTTNPMCIGYTIIN